jgi:hypothetical protein
MPHETSFMAVQIYSASVKTGCDYSRGRWESYAESDNYEGFSRVHIIKAVLLMPSHKTFDFLSLYTTILSIIAYILYLFYLSRHIALTRYFFAMYVPDQTKAFSGTPGTFLALGT